VTTDLILVGGGLANSLIAYRLHQRNPRLALQLIEREPALGGNHVWSFHDHDLTPEQHEWIAPLVECSWATHEVRFPRLRRRLGGGYHALTSERLHRVVAATLGSSLRLRCAVARVHPSSVELVGGAVLQAAAVLDGRGDLRSAALDIGFQKFVGRWLELEQPHGLRGPILMDATVEQRDGFRFVYSLPFGPRLVHVEDTRYSDTPRLDPAQLGAGIEQYAAVQGWAVHAVHREEHGVLPIVLGGDIDAFWEEGEAGVPRTGVRAALFHPTTGYSLPEAVRLADAIGEASRLDAAALYALTRRRSTDRWRRDGFFRLLNRMLFRAADPARRYLVLQRFYGLSETLIRRFYSGRLTRADQVRLLIGKPPVPMLRALSCLFDRHVPAARESVR